MIRKSNIFFILFILAFSYNAAQTYICTYCGRTIQEELLKVDNRYYHPQHFKCSKCKLPIDGPYLNKNGRYYHQNCSGGSAQLLCNYCNLDILGMHIVQGSKKYHNECYKNIMPKCRECGKSIEGKYYVKNGDKIHETCYLEDVAAKCDVCKKALSGRYMIDIHDNKYHDYHESTNPKCDNCNRIIAKYTTAGGKRYPDGREMCMFCVKNAITGYIEVKTLFNKIVKELSHIGFEVDMTNVVLEGADRRKLKDIAKGNYSDAMRGYCQTLVETKTFKSKKTVTKYFTIHILEGIPKDYISVTIVHELMHVWIIQNTNISHSPQLVEGSCNYLGYLYLKNKSGVMIDEVIRGLEKDPDPVYGDGFREVKNRYKRMSLHQIFEYLKSNSEI